MATIKRRLFLGTVLGALPALSLANRVPPAERRGIKVAAEQDRFGKARAIGFNTTTFKVARDDTQGALFLMEQRSRKPGGPPLHLHHEQDEFWYVVSGQYLFQVGGERYRAEAGDCLVGPRTLPHAYAYVGGSRGILLIGFTPAGRMQEYFERPRTPGAYVADAALYHAYGMELLGAPLPLDGSE